ncbi:MAG TPA: hypothetical protein VM847_02120 [Tahibacter sp.]|nr:hypothetical protein [Tahibacter sp.]
MKGIVDRKWTCTIEKAGRRARRSAAAELIVESAPRPVVENNLRAIRGWIARESITQRVGSRGTSQAGLAPFDRKRAGARSSI